MRVLPILFQDDMQKANLYNRKTQTRRLRGLQRANQNPDVWHIESRPNYRAKGLQFTFRNSKGDHIELISPYGMPGDILWVREAWRQDENGDYQYRASTGNSYKFKWKPSIHMPFKAARSFLKVTNIRIERLNTISDADAIAEGIDFTEYEAISEAHPAYRSYMNYLPGKDFITLCDEAGYSWNYGKETHTAAVASYCSLWCEINDADSWNANPWVWVVEYELTDKPE